MRRRWWPPSSGSLEDEHGNACLDHARSKKNDTIIGLLTAPDSFANKEGRHADEGHVLVTRRVCE